MVNLPANAGHMGLIPGLEVPTCPVQLSLCAKSTELTPI